MHTYGRIRILKCIQECNYTPLKFLTFYVCEFKEQKREHDFNVLMTQCGRH
jgi:hypothetical protein